MPHQNCHLIEHRLKDAKEKLSELRTNINIHAQYLITHPGHQPTINLLAQLRVLESQQESTVQGIQSELDVCESQQDNR
jgi:hypothetical protein